MSSAEYSVSIPDRVLGFFRPIYYQISGVLKGVSIPDRVLGFFRLKSFAPAVIPEFEGVSIPDRVLGFFRPGSIVV